MPDPETNPDDLTRTAPATVDVMIAEAEAAGEQGDLEAGIEAFARLRDAFPGLAIGYYRGAEILRQAGRLEEALHVAAIGSAMMPDSADILHQYALALLDRGNYEEAAQNWLLMRESFPDRAEGYQYGIMALRLADQLEDAELLAEIAIAKFPVPDSWTEYVLLGVHKQDWEATIARAEQMRDLFPDAVEGYRFGMAALRETGRFPDAEELGAAGIAIAPESADIRIEHALSALQGGDAAEAVRRWTVVREAFPDRPEGYLYGVLALREADEEAAAEQLAAVAADLFPDNLDFVRQGALAAVQQADWPEAIRLADTMRSAFPHDVDGFRLGILALREAGQLQEAERLADVALQRFEGNRDLLIEHASTAVAQGDAILAAQRWEAVREAAPELVDGYRFGIVALREAGRMAEAERLGDLALQTLPPHAELWNEHARTALNRGDMAEAGRRWAAMRERFPDDPAGYAGGIIAHREAAPFAEAEKQVRVAEEIARVGLRRFPDDPVLWREHAMTAVYSRDWQEAANRWADVRARYPDDPDAYRIGALTLRNANQPDRADEVILEGLRKFQNEADFWIEYANNADHANNPAEAARRWEQMRQRFPGREEGYARGVLSLLDAGDFDAAEAVSTASMARFAGDANRELMMRFESLGDNCEFGLAQRRFGAEPMGLLRWSGILPDELARALRTRFERAGDPELVEILVADNGNFMVADNGIGSIMNSFVNEQAMDRTKFLELNCRRLRFLRDKLVSDLEAGEKIFVYNPRNGQISDAEIAAIHAGIRALGTGSLVCVRETAQARQNGTVEKRHDGLMIGYLTRSAGMAPDLEALHTSWLQICRTAAAMVDAAGRG